MPLKFILFVFSSFLIISPGYSDKLIVGATELIHVGDQQLSFHARVDSGAQTTSIHAENIKRISGHAQNPYIVFNIVNEKGQVETLERQVIDTVNVKTSEGSEQRYKIWLTLKFKHIDKNVEVTLNDRSQMKYRLLLGRNWLSGDFIVDVDKKS